MWNCAGTRVPYLYQLEVDEPNHSKLVFATTVYRHAAGL
jgi:hypothetical protein